MLVALYPLIMPKPNELMDLAQFQQHLEENGGKPALGRLKRAGADETSLLDHLRRVPTVDPEAAFGWPSWLDMKQVDRLLKLIRDTAQMLTRFEDTTVGPTGLLTGLQYREQFAQLKRTVPDLRLYETYLHGLRKEIARFNRYKSQHCRALLHRGFADFIHAVTQGQRLDEEVAEILTVAYRAYGLRIKVSRDSIRRFRDRNPQLKIALAFPPFSLKTK